MKRVLMIILSDLIASKATEMKNTATHASTISGRQRIIQKPASLPASTGVTFTYM
jgi:hypothetical protein